MRRLTVSSSFFELGGHTMGVFAKNYTVEELNAMGINVIKGIREEYQEAREEMGEDFIEMEKIDEYIEPDYYHNGTDGADTIEMIYRTFPFEHFRGFMKGNVIKYVTRYDRKNGPEDLKKAHTYLDRLRDYEERHAAAKLLDEQGAELDKALDKLSDYPIPSFSEQLASKRLEGEL